MTASARDGSHALELDAPDITPYARGNTGIPFFTTFDSGRPGPHAMVMAVTHGNEICGAITLDFLFRQNLRPTRGRLTFGFANHMAYGRFDPADPNASRFVDEDLNRLWSPATLDGARDSVELRRVREMRPFIDTVDLLLDIHSMRHDDVPLMLAGPLAKGRDFAKALGYPTHIVCDRGHAAGPRMRDYASFADPRSPRNALLLEAGQHWRRSSADASLQATLRFLLTADVIAPGFAEPYLAPMAASQRIIEVTDAVTIESEAFTFTRAFRGMEVIRKAGTLLGHDGRREVHTPYDDCVLIMPSQRLARNRGGTAVRLGRYVD